MTFHGSKGLEFPVCFIYNCGARFGDLSVRGDLLFLRRLGASMMLFYRTGDLGEGFKKNTVLRNIAKYAITLAEREAEMQNLYVAMTRAREYLYISASPSQASMANVGFDKGDRFRTLYSSCYSAWILTGLEKASNINEFCDLEYKDAATVSPAEPLPLDYSTQTSPALDDEFCSRYRKLADMTVDATKEEKFLRSLPTKAPASKLADDMLDRYVFSCDTVPSSTDLGIQTDEDSDLPFSDSGLDYRARESVLENLRLMKSSDGSDFEHLLGENQRPTAAERGTAAHAFLQYCDLKKFISADENSDTDALVREEIARLTLLGFIEDGAGKMLDVSQLVAFFKSNFFKVVRDAVEYRRELRFNRFVPLASLTKNPAVAAVVGDRTLYVQGSIDLTLHTKDGGIILCDYKSDRITDEERASRALLASNMKRKHSAQLKQYSKAIFDH